MKPINKQRIFIIVATLGLMFIVQTAAFACSCCGPQKEIKKVCTGDACAQKK